MTSSELAGIFPKEDKPHDIYLYRVLSCTGRLRLNEESSGWAWVDVQDDGVVQKMRVRQRYAGLVRDAQGWNIETAWSGENYLLTE